MSLVNNFELIAHILRQKSNPTDDDMFMVQTLRRRKENPEQESNNRTIKVRYPKNADDLLKYQDEIIAECFAHNARSYINLNRRSKKRVALEALAKTARVIANGQYDVRNVYDSAAGEFSSDPEKTWVIDIDYPNGGLLSMEEWNHYMDGMNSTIRGLMDEIDRTPIFRTVPTKNGVHWIVSPFNLQTFKQSYPGIDVHKDNPTILYVP